MIKKITYKLMKWLAIQALKWVYMYIDVNKDGLLSKKEIVEFTVKIKKIIKR